MITLVRKSTKADHLARNYANLDQMANYNAKPLVARHSRCGRPPTGFPGSQQDFRAPMWPTRCKVVAIFAAKSQCRFFLLFNMQAIRIGRRYGLTYWVPEVIPGAYCD
jgi:hypothetical protein